MKTRYTFALMLGMVCSLVNTGEAQAQYGLQGAGYGGFGSYDVGRLYGVLANNVPYFAAFPPVYYSAPVPRTYGHSPFAYPPGVMTPEVAQVASQEILNPYVPASTPSETPAESSDKVTQVNKRPQPLTVMNPYASTRLAKNAGL